jgi:TonB-linked SusC/RagA family outer membrane protein
MRRSLLKRHVCSLALLVVFGLFQFHQVHAQTTSVSGLVRSESGDPLPGVNVIDKGTTRGAVTDAEGKFTVEASQNSVLVFSFIGMTNTEVNVGGRTYIETTLMADITQLDEIVVVGYGTQKKSDVTGSVASVPMSELKNTPITRADQFLQGRISGVQVTQTNAEPGGNISIRIRGTNSISSGNEPLFVIDGFPGAGNLNTINPSDIESIDVLKDASATAIYGSRGANGVVIITTKKGKADQNTVSVELYTGVQTVRNQYDLMNAPQFASYLNDVVTLTNQETGGTTALPYPTQADIDALGTGTHWQNELFRSAPIRNFQLGFNGGNNGTLYNISFNYFDQQGVIINSGLKRGSLRINLERKISKKLNFTFSGQLTRSAEEKALVNTAGGSAGGVIMDAMRISPALPVYDANGKFTLRNAPLPYVEGQVGNPVAYSTMASDNRNVFRTLLNAAGEYEIIKGLKLRVSGGTDFSYGNNDSYVPSGLWFQNTNSLGAATQASANRYSWVNENTLTLDKKITEHHGVNVVAGFSAQQFINTNVNASVSNFFTDALGADNISFGSNILTPTSGKNTNSLASYFGRVNYNFKHKYLFTFTMRADGSSRFGVNNKWGYFPSAAVAWRVIEENFMTNLAFVSDLKLRGSYGVTGNQEIGSYRSMARYQSFAGHNQRTDYIAGSNRLIGLAPGGIPNSDLSWESTEALNVGIDAGFANNRIQLTADYYHKTTKDLLLDASIPRTTGFNSILLNAGSVENKGIELGLSTITVDRGKFRWTSNLNFSANRNKVLDLNGETERFVGASSNSLFPGGNGSTSVLRVGEPIGTFYGYQFDGIWQTPEDIAASGMTSPVYRPGDPRYVDQNGDGVINPEDRVIIGRAQPNFIYGFTNTVSYSNLSLSVLLQGVSGSDILNLNRYELESGSVATNKMTTMLDRWTGPGTSNTLPKANSTIRRSTGITDEVLEDGSFLRVKTITLGYNIPVPKVLSSAIRSANIYVTGQNLFTVTDYLGYDPEVNSFGSENLNLNTDYNAYPTSKSVIVGARFEF